MKILIYCTRAKPFLFNVGDYPYDILEKEKFILRTKKGIKKDIIGNASYIDGGDLWPAMDEVMKAKLNGLVCFECDCKESFDWNKTPNIEEAYSLLERACLSDECFLKYKGKSNQAFFYHFENVKHIKPFPITELYRDGTMVYPLTRAPESYCFAYQKVETTKEGYLANVGKDESRYYLQENGKFFYSEKVLVFSIRSKWLCKIANGEKDLEVRKTRIQNAGIEYK